MGANPFHAPLEPQDTEKETLGCRLASPDICAKHSMQNVCAFVRDDGMCTSPPMGWRKQFRRLKLLADGGLSPTSSAEAHRRGGAR